MVPHVEIFGVLPRQIYCACGCEMFIQYEFYLGGEILTVVVLINAVLCSSARCVHVCRMYRDRWILSCCMCRKTGALSTVSISVGDYKIQPIFDM